MASRCTVHSAPHNSNEKMPLKQYVELLCPQLTSKDLVLTHDNDTHDKRIAKRVVSNSPTTTDLNKLRVHTSTKNPTGKKGECLWCRRVNDVRSEIVWVCTHPDCNAECNAIAPFFCCPSRRDCFNQHITFGLHPKEALQQEPWKSQVEEKGSEAWRWQMWGTLKSQNARRLVGLARNVRRRRRKARSKPACATKNTAICTLS